MHVQSNTAVAACHNVHEAPVRQAMKGDCVEGGTLIRAQRFRENQDVLRGGTMRFAEDVCRLSSASSRWLSILEDSAGMPPEEFPNVLRFPPRALHRKSIVPSSNLINAFSALGSHEHYFRIACNPSAIGCKLQIELPTSRKGTAATQGKLSDQRYQAVAP